MRVRLAGVNEGESGNHLTTSCLARGLRSDCSLNSSLGVVLGVVLGVGRHFVPRLAFPQALGVNLGPRRRLVARVAFAQLLALGLGHGLRDRPKVNGYWLRARPILLQARHTRSAKRETAGQGGRDSQGGRQGGAHRHVVRACALCSSWCSRKARSVVATRIARRGQTPPFAEFKHDCPRNGLGTARRGPSTQENTYFKYAGEPTMLVTNPELLVPTNGS